MIQIDIPMPTNCATCRIQHNIGCNIAKDNGMNTKERDVRCPVKELIQCKDCKYVCLCDSTEMMPDIPVFAKCTLTDEVHDPEWFCADGKKRDNNDG